MQELKTNALDSVSFFHPSRPIKNAKRNFWGFYKTKLENTP
jgi:hypothetical protein